MKDLCDSGGDNNYKGKIKTWYRLLQLIKVYSTYELVEDELNYEIKMICFLLLCCISRYFVVLFVGIFFIRFWSILNFWGQSARLDYKLGNLGYFFSMQHSISRQIKGLEVGPNLLSDPEALSWRVPASKSSFKTLLINIFCLCATYFQNTVLYQMDR